MIDVLLATWPVAPQISTNAKGHDVRQEVSHLPEREKMHWRDEVHGDLAHHDTEKAVRSAQTPVEVVDLGGRYADPLVQLRTTSPQPAAAYKRHRAHSTHALTLVRVVDVFAADEAIHNHHYNFHRQGLPWDRMSTILRQPACRSTLFPG